jgi:multicomponent Na+:H+ antiporter subunit C
MEIILAFIIGGLFSLGLYMILRRSMVKLVIGFILFSHASHLLIFTVSGLTRGSIPIISKNETVLLGDVADPLPQALILTAIVISFGLTAFAIILIKSVYLTEESDDLDTMNKTDKI